MKENGYILLLDSHTSDLNIRLTNIDVSLFSPLHLFVILYAFKRYLYDLIAKRNLRFIIFEAKGEQAVNV
jgi:hypothetical protein